MAPILEFCSGGCLPRVSQGPWAAVREAAPCHSGEGGGRKSFLEETTTNTEFGASHAQSNKNSDDIQEHSGFYLLLFPTVWRGPKDGDDYAPLLQRSQLPHPWSCPHIGPSMRNSHQSMLEGARRVEPVAGLCPSCLG